MKDETVIGLLLARKGSKGLPGKNRLEFRGKPMYRYALDAAAASGVVDQIYVSTDDEEILAASTDLGCHPIARPRELATDAALMIDAIRHAHDTIVAACCGPDPDLLVVMLANAPTTTPSMIRRGVELARSRPDADATLPVAELPEWSPLRALAMSDGGELAPWAPEAQARYATSSNRQQLPSTFFATNAFFVIRPRALITTTSPFSFPWLGERAIGFRDPYGGLDIDTEADLWAATAWWERAEANGDDK